MILLERSRILYMVTIRNFICSTCFLRHWTNTRPNSFTMNWNGISFLQLTNNSSSRFWLIPQGIIAVNRSIRLDRMPIYANI